MKKRILVIADQDFKDTQALEKANQIANLFVSTVFVVAFVDGDKNREDIQHHEQTLKQQVLDIFDETFDVSSQVAATSNISKWVKKHVTDFDLVIKTGNRSEKLFYTPTDWQLIRHIDCTLLITSTKKWNPKSTILASVDVTDDNATQKAINTQVLKEANLWAQTQNYKLHVAYSVPVPKAALEFDMIAMDEVKLERLPEAKKRMSELIGSAQLDGIEQHIEFGDAERRIPSIANKVKADLVIMGSVGRKGVNGFLLGNTAEKVMRNLRTDILIIKPGS